MKRRWTAALFAALALSALAGCKREAAVTGGELWDRAMADAVFSEDEEVMELVTLTQEDPMVIWDDAGERVLLLTWHNYDSDCIPGLPLGEEAGEIWATSVGEMTAWYEENGGGVEDWELRFAQLLGVHADEGYTRFTAFWVSPEDVIRPAYRTDVTEQMVNGYDQVTDEAYKAWFDGNIIWSYFASDYPWTRLGYTYDWSGDGDEYGLTEFLVAAGDKTEIALTWTTGEFVDWLAEQSAG